MSINSEEVLYKHFATEHYINSFIVPYINQWISITEMVKNFHSISLSSFIRSSTIIEANMKTLQLESIVNSVAHPLLEWNLDKLYKVGYNLQLDSNKTTRSN